MPIYEYRCRACGHRFERLQRVGAGADGVCCPSCGAEAADKQLSAFAASPSSGSAGGATRSGGGGGCGSGFT